METVMVIRMKRSRGDVGADTVLLDVSGSRGAKSARPASLEAAMGGLGVSDAAAAPAAPPPRLKLKRIACDSAGATVRTLPPALLRGLRSLKNKERHRDVSRVEQVSAARAAARGKSLWRVRVFDAEVGAALASGASSTAADGDASVGGSDGRLRRRWMGTRDAQSAASRVNFVALTAVMPNRILSPQQRAVDEAIWSAFRTRNASRLLHTLTSLGGGVYVNFQRVCADLTTLLMAAAYCGDMALVSTLIRQGALARIVDADGRSAAGFARAAGFPGLADLLDDVAADEVAEIKAWGSYGREEGAEASNTAEDPESFDYYMVDAAEPKPSESDGATGSAASAAASAPILRVDGSAALSSGAILFGASSGIADGEDEDGSWDLVWDEHTGGLDDDDNDGADSVDPDAEEIDYPEDESGPSSDDDDGCDSGDTEHESVDS